MASFIPVTGAQDHPTIRVGSKDFPEAIIIGEMYALLLENAGATVERKMNLGGTAVAHEALLSGALDLYPEYTGTGLLAVLGASMTVVPGLMGTPEAMGIALLIAIPFGILVATVRPLSLPVMLSLSVAYTIPSLAFLAFLIP